MRAHRADRRVVAVTGGRAFLGRALLARLEKDARCARLFAVDVGPPGGLVRTEFHKVDLTLPNAGAMCAEIFARERVDTVVHAAFLGEPTHNGAWAHELEVIGTVHLLDACAEARVRKFVMKSTTGVYGPNPLNPNFLDEEHEPRGLGSSRFFNDKVEAEREVLRYRDETPDAVVTVLRVAPILGPTVRNYAARYLRGPVLPVLMGYDPLLQFVHEDDAVRAFEIACERDHPGVFNIVGDGVLPLATVIARLGRLRVPVPHFVAYPLARLLWATQAMETPPNFLDWLRYVCVADGRKAREEMGFVPRHDIRAILDDFLGLPRVEPDVAASPGPPVDP